MINNYYILEIQQNFHENVSIEELVACTNEVDLRKVTEPEIHASYFDTAFRNGENTTKGVVETPRSIAKYMVTQSIKLSHREPRKIHWFDPCCGSGVFPSCLIEAYAEMHEIVDVFDLPKLMVCDLSLSGLWHTCLTIGRKLEQVSQLTLKDYVESGRLCMSVGDTLEFFTEQPGFFDKARPQFDVVIGNPPYVRATRLSKAYKSFLSRFFSATYSGGADLYFYFLAGAINSLSEAGIVNFISPASFFKTKAAQKLRADIDKRTIPLQVFDLDELPVFENASIHSAVYWLRKVGKKPKGGSFSYRHMKKKTELAELAAGEVGVVSVPLSTINGRSWQPEASFLNLALSKTPNTIELQETNSKVYSGIRPALKKPYVYDREQLSSLDQELVKSWFVPCIEAKSIARWETQPSDRWLLKIPAGTQFIPTEIEVLLQNYRQELQLRQGDSSGQHWACLRSCSYYSAFEVDGIIFPDIATESRFSRSLPGHYPIDGTFFISQGSLALLGVLNSNHAWKYLAAHCSSIGNPLNRGRLRLKKTFLERFPVPKVILNNSTIAEDITSIVKDILDKDMSSDRLETLDHLVEEAYRI